MFQQLFGIVKNRVKGQAIDFLLQVAIDTLSEYRRASSQGQFDVNKQGSAMPPMPKSDVSQNSYINNLFK